MHSNPYLRYIEVKPAVQFELEKKKKKQKPSGSSQQKQ